MSASLVGSEMCIRDRGTGNYMWWVTARGAPHPPGRLGTPCAVKWGFEGCLLYTSDAADDM
eukprot:10960105-Alexandrium_andersonii.AAC.1